MSPSSESLSSPDQLLTNHCPDMETLVEDSLSQPNEFGRGTADDGSRPSPKRRQVPKAPGGVNENLKVLYCIGIPSNSNYKKMYRIFSEFGSIDRIRLVLTKSEDNFDGYIVFNTAVDAHNAWTSIVNKDIPELQSNARLYDIRNFEQNDGDYIPHNNNKYRHIARVMQLPTWHVVSCKDGFNNILMARECLEEHVGEISERNISRYGKNILVKAQHKTQAKLLTTFTPEEGDIVTSASPHRSFNTARGVVFSRDLYDYEEVEILKRCPEEVLSVKKLKGKNGAIQLTFNSCYLPKYIRIAKVTMNVKKFRQRPIQCYRCFEFGHVEGNCPPERTKRC